MRQAVRWAAIVPLALTLLACASSGPRQPENVVPPGEHERIAVLDLAAVGTTQADALALSERLRNSLRMTGRFDPADRGWVQAMLDRPGVPQHGCTSRECAAKVGQILGVRKVVLGKVVAVSDGTWLLSGLIVDADTSQTLDTESVIHKGDFSTLLLQPVEQLAAELAGMGKASAPNGDTEAAGLQGLLAPGTVERLAILPPLLVGNQAELSAQQADLTAALDRAIRARPEVTLSYVDYRDRNNPGPYLALKAHSNIGSLRGRIWKGLFWKDLDVKAIRELGRELQVDVILTHRSSYESSGSSFTAYLVDVHTGKVYEKSLPFAAGTLGKWGERMSVALNYLLDRQEADSTQTRASAASLKPVPR